MDIQKLLFVTKFEDLCFDALQSLLTLRQASLNHVVFLNVIERDRVALRRGTGYQKQEFVKLKERANIRFINWAETLFEQGMEVGVYIVVGSLAPQVIEAARKEEADLIVIGRSHTGKLKQLYAGSDITEILRRASIPVLVYKAVGDASTVTEPIFERPLLAVDWSAAGMRAVDYLAGLKDVCRQVHLVHVAGEKELKGTSAMAIQKTRKETREKLDRICDRLEASGIQARSHVHVGDPFQELERAARECQATLIVAGSSEKSAAVERWIGSTSLKLAEKSMFPTLIIPPNNN
jgi:nucleotide-binding universal stress UspA family protein